MSRTVSFYPAPVTNARPTMRHRLAIAPGILGTVYGVSPSGEARYFDYDLPGAIAFAGITPDSDLRLSVPADRIPTMHVTKGATEANPGPKTRCVWVRP